MARVKLPIARLDDFTVYRIVNTSAPSPDWVNLKLECPNRGQKKNWWVGWSGERFAHSTDLELLKKHEPRIYALLRSLVKANFPKTRRKV
jgi:hypothetical protein